MFGRGSSSGSSKRPFFGLRLATYFLSLIIILFYVLALVGCVSTSPGISNIFLVKLKNVTGTKGKYDFSMRVNYFGLCAAKDHHLKCVSTSGKSSSSTAKNLAKQLEMQENDMKLSVDQAYTLTDHIFLYLIVPAFALFCLAFVVHVLAEVAFRARTKMLISVVAFFSSASIALALATAVGTAQTANATKYFTDPKKWVNAPKDSDNKSFLSVSTGASIQFLQFMVFVLQLVWALLSTRVLGGGKKEESYTYRMS